MDIRILPSNIANMIAAGEVVQRPASVVKELMENAVDAGATQISVIIKDAGRTLVQVIDNGCGMSPDQAVLAFERHATSKIATAEDLEDISTFGFRGEALASIAAVAEVTLSTRRAEDELGCRVEFADSRHLSTVETAAPVGSNFQVRNLFYNVPARRKFLKSDSVEFKHIVTEFQHVAFCCPEIAFTLIHNDREIYVLKAVKSLKFRILDVAGASVASEIVDLSANTSVVNVSGFIGRPDKARKSLGYQLFFVNGRYFRSPYLHKAVMKAYEDMVPEGMTPSYFIYLAIDPHGVDVNIHPTKAEVKFEDDSVIFQTMYACVREALGRHSFGAAIDFETSASRQIPSLGSNFEEYTRISEPEVGTHGYNPFDNDGFPNEASFQSGLQNRNPDGPRNGVSDGPYREFAGGFESGTADGWAQPWNEGGNIQSRQMQHIPGTSSYVGNSQDYGVLFDGNMRNTRPGQDSILIVGGKYVVTNSRSGMMIIHARRAMERILYDRFIKASDDAGEDGLSQAVLFPVQVQVGVENMALIVEYASLLRKFGFDIAPFGNDTVVVNGVPAGFPSEEDKVVAMTGDLILLLQGAGASLASLVVSETAGKFALLGASAYTCPRSLAEAASLVESLLASSNPEYTSSGRKIMLIMTASDMDAKF